MLSSQEERGLKYGLRQDMPVSIQRPALLLGEWLGGCAG